MCVWRLICPSFHLLQPSALVWYIHPHATIPRLLNLYNNNNQVLLVNSSVECQPRRNPSSTGVNSVSVGVKQVSGGVKQVSVGVNPVNEGVNPVIEGVNLVSLGVKPVSVGVITVIVGVNTVNI